MKPTGNATPRPWRLGHDCENNLCIYADNAVDLVAEWNGTDEDAELITLAVNRDHLFERMVEALENCWQATGEAYKDCCSKEKLLAANTEARAILKAVEEEKCANSG